MMRKKNLREGKNIMNYILNVKKKNKISDYIYEL